MAECRGLRCAGCDTFPDSGAVAQLGERLVRNEEVSGSIPLSSTITKKTFVTVYRVTHVAGDHAYGVPFDTPLVYTTKIRSKSSVCACTRGHNSVYFSHTRKHCQHRPFETERQYALALFVLFF